MLWREDYDRGTVESRLGQGDRRGQRVVSRQWRTESDRGNGEEQIVIRGVVKGRQ